MKSIFKFALLPALFVAAVCRGAGEPQVGLRCDFASERDLGDDWRTIGSFMVPLWTHFHIADVPGAANGRALVVEANNSGGFMIVRFRGVDLGKHPRLHWRWRIVRPMKVAVGRRDPDDQACVIYIADGTQVRQRCVGYRWEFNTPVGATAMLKYGGGIRLVKAFCLRNRETPAGEWVEEERDVVADFKDAFGVAPAHDFVVVIGGNSQHSRSNTRVEIDYIEFRSAPAPGN